MIPCATTYHCIDASGSIDLSFGVCRRHESFVLPPSCGSAPRRIFAPSCCHLCGPGPPRRWRGVASGGLRTGQAQRQDFLCNWPCDSGEGLEWFRGLGLHRRSGCGGLRGTRGRLAYLHRAAGLEEKATDSCFPGNAHFRHYPGAGVETPPQNCPRSGTVMHLHAGAGVEPLCLRDRNN
jgi:hypothetical protein